MATATKAKKKAAQPHPVDSSPWLSKHQAAAYMDLSLHSVRRLIEQGLVPIYKPVPGRTLLRRSDLDAYLESQRVQADA
jgi:excisionase family DNA binding protein